MLWFILALIIYCLFLNYEILASFQDSKFTLTKITNISVALVAPLDWGLGHTTRCIPVIRQLQQYGFKVIVAAEGAQATILTQEFPDITIISLAGYRIQYTQHKRWLALKILQQVPKIMHTIRQEHNWLQKIVVKHNIQLIISDNRFGLWHPTVTSVFLTHQLAIQAPLGWLRKLLQLVNYKHINHFHHCWIPDMESSEANIAGKLSHPAQLPSTPVQYIGPLSRFSDSTPSTAPFHYKWLFILSGPEPQRSLLEAKLLTVAAKLNAAVYILRARPGAVDLPEVPSNCTIVNHLASSEIEQLFYKSEFIVTRSGYTTVMELLSLRKKAVLIPTPGQTEQEYLANRLAQQHWCYSCLQHEDLLWHLLNAEAFSYQLPEIPGHQLVRAIEKL